MLFILTAAIHGRNNFRIRNEIPSYKKRMLLSEGGLDVPKFLLYPISVVWHFQLLHETKPSWNDRVFVPFCMRSKEMSFYLIHLACFGNSRHLIYFTTEVEERGCHHDKPCICSEVKCIDLIKTQKRYEKTNICVRQDISCEISLMLQEFSSGVECVYTAFKLNRCRVSNTFETFIWKMCTLCYIPVSSSIARSYAACVLANPHRYTPWIIIGYNH